MRLIDADELKKALGITSEDCNKCGWGSYESCGRGNDFEDACVAIDNAVTVDAVSIVHGWWIKVGYIEHTWLVSKCSVCGKQTIDAGTYCTNCGALMDGKEDGNETD